MKCRPYIYDIYFRTFFSIVKSTQISTRLRRKTWWQRDALHASWILHQADVFHHDIKVQFLITIWQDIKQKHNIDQQNKHT